MTWLFKSSLALLSVLSLSRGQEWRNLKVSPAVVGAPEAVAGLNPTPPRFSSRPPTSPDSCPQSH